MITSIPARNIPQLTEMSNIDHGDEQYQTDIDITLDVKVPGQRLQTGIPGIGLPGISCFRQPPPCSPPRMEKAQSLLGVNGRHEIISNQSIQPACQHRQDQGKPMEPLPRLEAEGVWPQVLEDARDARLKPRYDGGTGRNIRCSARPP
jgi:hypothetical protein